MRYVLVTLALATISCSTPPDTALSERAATAALVAKLEAAREEVERLDKTIETLRGEVETLRAEKAELEAQLEKAEVAAVDLTALRNAREEAQRYKEGLERAVEELNQRSGEPYTANLPETGDRPVRSKIYVRQPQAVVTNLDVVTEGTVHNAGSETSVGFLELILWVDGRRETSTTLNLEIAPRTVMDYDWTFRNAVAGGEQARVEALWGEFRSSEVF
ncbi:MAG: hypothetical protein AAF657_35640 [Acidobacteriota bacterium]